MLKTIFLSILLILSPSFILPSNPIIIQEEFDVMEYDIVNQYFIYTDENKNIKKISWDNSGWNSDSSNVHIIQSDKLYIKRIIQTDGKYSNTKYILYINNT